MKITAFDWQYVPQLKLQCNGTKTLIKAKEDDDKVFDVFWCQVNSSHCITFGILVACPMRN